MVHGHVVRRGHALELPDTDGLRPIDHIGMFSLRNILHEHTTAQMVRLTLTYFAAGITKLVSAQTLIPEDSARHPQAVKIHSDTPLTVIWLLSK